MARPRTGDKHRQIRDATVAEIADVGAATASVNAIAKRAGLAVGTLYRYHANKEVLLQSVYLDIKNEIHDALMKAADAHVSSEGKIRAMWFALLDYAQLHPNAFALTEVMLNTGILTAEQQAAVSAMAQDISSIIKKAVADGTLIPASSEAITSLLVAPALRLGRASATSGAPLNPAYTEEVFSLCWRAIAK